MPNIDIIAGARPNFIKIAPIIHALEKRRANGSDISYRLVHTGQHYSANMSANFFKQLDIPEPHVNLEATGTTQAEQAASIMIRYEALISTQKSSCCLVVGDVTSTMACAISAKKSGMKVAHVEAGIRSGDWSMPEEVNRVVTDSLCDWYFTTTEQASQNLVQAGAATDCVFFVGNVMIDTLLANRQRFRPAPEIQQLGLPDKGYVVLTLHRPQNVDEKEPFHAMLDCISKALVDTPIIFPVHPRTNKLLDRSYWRERNITCIDPLGYLEFMHLVEQAKGVVTDSGGVSEETTVLGVPCITLRDNTERPETVDIGTNVLAGTEPTSFVKYLRQLAVNQWKTGSTPEKWDGKSAMRIVGQLELLLYGIRRN